MAWLKQYKIALVLACIKFILPFILQDVTYELHRDEYLYLAEARHLAWGYMEVPPLLSVFARFSAVFGNGFFWVKFWPSLFGALTVWTTRSIVKEMVAAVTHSFLQHFALLPAFTHASIFLFNPIFSRSTGGHFASVKIVDSVTNPFARDAGTKITLLQGADDQVNAGLGQRIGSMKDQFKR